MAKLTRLEKAAAAGTVVAGIAAVVALFPLKSDPVRIDPIKIEVETRPSIEDRLMADSHVFRGVSELFVAYNKGGLVGMQTAVRDCYESIKHDPPGFDYDDEIKRCFAMDLSAAWIDEGMAKAMGFPRFEYFEFDQVNARAHAAMLKHMDNALSEKFIVGWIPVIRKHYEDIGLKNIGK